MRAYIFFALLFAGCQPGGPSAGDIYKNDVSGATVELVNVGTCETILQVNENINETVHNGANGIEALFDDPQGRCFSYMVSEVITEPVLSDTMITFIRPVSHLEQWRKLN